MFTAIDLTFLKGEILTKVMLDELYQFPKTVLSLQYHNFPDGILCGTAIFEEDGEIFMDKGLIKYQDTFYRMETTFPLSRFVADHFEDGRCVPQKSYKIVLIPSKNVIDKREGQVSLTLMPEILQTSEEAKGIPIAFFNSINQTVKLPHFSPSLELKEFSKFVKTVSFSMVAVPYASQSGVTFHPYLFSKIKDSLQLKPEKTALDYMILQEIAKNKVIELEFLELIVKDFVKEKKWEQLNQLPFLQRREELLLNFVQSLLVRSQAIPLTVTGETQQSATTRIGTGGSL